MKVKVLLIAVCLVLLPIKMTYAEIPDVCAGLEGKAKGICIAATKGVMCGDTEPAATKPACDRLEAEFREATDGLVNPPWIPTCPCTPYWEDFASWLETKTGSYSLFCTGYNGSEGVTQVFYYSDIIDDLRGGIYYRTYADGTINYYCNSQTHTSGSGSAWFSPEDWYNKPEIWDQCTTDMESIMNRFGVSCY